MASAPPDILQSPFLPRHALHVPMLKGFTIESGIVRPRLFADLDGPAGNTLLVSLAPSPPPVPTAPETPSPSVRKGPSAVVAKRGTPSVPILRDLATESYRLLESAVDICGSIGVRGPSLLREGWKVEFRPRKGNFHGWCSYTDRLIAIFVSPALRAEDALNTIRHEFAHAVTHRHWPGGRSHGAEWKRCASTLGARPERCRANTEEEKEYFRQTAKWLLRIKGTKEIVGAYRRKPSDTNLAHQWIKGRRDETYGMLEIVPAQGP